MGESKATNSDRGSQSIRVKVTEYATAKVQAARAIICVSALKKSAVWKKKRLKEYKTGHPGRQERMENRAGFKHTKKSGGIQRSVVLRNKDGREVPGQCELKCSEGCQA